MKYSTENFTSWEVGKAAPPPALLQSVCDVSLPLPDPGSDSAGACEGGRAFIPLHIPLLLSNQAGPSLHARGDKVLSGCGYSGNNVSARWVREDPNGRMWLVGILGVSHICNTTTTMGRGPHGVESMPETSRH